MGRRAYLPWVAVGVYFLAVFIWMGRDRRLTREAFEPCSTRNTSPEGLSLAFKYLRERARLAGGGRVELLTRPFERAALEADAVLFRVRPSMRSLLEGLWTEPKDEKGSTREAAGRFLTAAEESWIHDGGRLVLALDEGCGELEVVPSGSGAVRKVYPIWPGVEELRPAPQRALAGGALDWMHGVFAVGQEPLVARRRLGEGELFVMSCPEIFQNGRIGRGDHLALLEELSGGGRPVYFDEYVHGLARGRGVLEIAKRAGLGPLVSLLVLTALAAYWRRRTRVGPEEDPYRETRVESVDFVDSLAQLYNRALRRRRAISLYHGALVRSVSVQTGLRGEALDAKVDGLAQGMRPPRPGRKRDIGAQEFRRALKAINKAFRRLADEKRA